MTTRTTRIDRWLRPVAVAAGALLLAGGCADDDSVAEPTPSTEPAAARLVPTVDHPYVAFALVPRAVYEGEEVDPETGDRIALRVESVVRADPSLIGGTRVTVVEVDDYEDGELVERTQDYYAQHPSGDVYYLGETVDEYEDGEVVGHAGQWIAGEGANRPGLFMPATPMVGAVFEQERAPGIAEDRSEVIETGLTVTVPAGTFDECLKTEDLDPLDDVVEFKYYCSGVGLVKEEYESGSLVLVDYQPG